MRNLSTGRIAALSVIALVVACTAPRPMTPLPVPGPQATASPAPPATEVQPLGPAVPPLDAPIDRPGVTTWPLDSAATAPAAPSVPATTPSGMMSFPVPPGTVVVGPTMSGVSQPPSHPPVTAQARGPAPADRAQYVEQSISVTGRVVQVATVGGVTSFLLQTPNEGWTVVVPSQMASTIPRGQTVSVTGYPHRNERNQLLAVSFGG